MAEEKKEIGSQREKIYLAVIAVLTITVAVLVWQVYDAKTSIQNISVANNNLEDDKAKLTNELNEMLQQYEDMETDNAELQADVLEQKERIEDLLDKVKNNEANIRTITKFKKEVKTLRTIMKGYVVTIDSLNTINIELNTQNQELNKKLSNTNKTNQQLKSEKENLKSIVMDASRLQIYDLKVNGLRTRINGSFTKSSRANRVEKIEACFNILENKTTKAGSKTMLMQLVDANGNLIATKDSGSVVIDKVELNYSASREFDYQNQEIELCIYAELVSEIPEGTYWVKLFDLGKEVGSHELVLK